MTRILLFFTLLFACHFGQTLLDQKEIKPCTLRGSGEKGICINLTDCKIAQDMLKNVQIKNSSILPTTCGFDGPSMNNVQVCCPKTRSEIGCYKYSKPSLKPGQIGCVKYRIVSYKGEKVSSKQYLHMAILGYGDKNNNEWLCSGSLISVNFVLTAAHCIKSLEFGSVQRVRLGDLDVRNETDDAEPQDFTVKQTFVYPKYKKISHYHDIALIELDRDVIISDYVRPICLPAKNFHNPKFNLIGAGWGQTDFGSKTSSHLLEVHLNSINHQTCKQRYENVSTRKLSNGILDELQICAGHPDGNDSCLGDSGGPLMQEDGECMDSYTIVGITSFGKVCGVEDSAGVYTRVSNYQDWIENIVWPETKNKSSEIHVRIFF